MALKAKLYKTRNILKALESYAEDNMLSVSECTFTLKKITTFIRTIHDKEFYLFENDLEHFTQEETILNEHVEFQQIYIIEVKQQHLCELALDYTIELGSFMTDPKIVVHPNSKIPHNNLSPQELYILLKKEFNKIKAKHSMLVHLFDTKMLKNLKVFTKYIYAGKFKKKLQISLFDGIEPGISRHGKLILWFEEKKHNNKIVEVEENELLVEYKKPLYGHNGFNAQGKQVDAQFEMLTNDIDAKIDPQSVLIQETAKSKLYKSKRKGYVSFDGETLTVNNKVHVATISRVEEKLAKRQDNNIEVHIAQQDTTKDSIGEGVELTSETIHVQGHVGAHSTLMAVNLDLQGATHQDSAQYAKFAKINRHKGTLRCHEAKIKLLEGGTVHATKVEIEASLNGTIYAQDVIIGNVKSNLKVYASNSITVRHVSGENNTFTIDYTKIPILKRKLELLDEEIEEFVYYLDEAKRHTPKKIKDLQDKIKIAKQEQAKITTSVKKATIHIQKPLRGINTILFSIDATHQLVYKTDAKEYPPFHLVENETSITLFPTNKFLSI